MTTGEAAARAWKGPGEYRALRCCAADWKQGPARCQYLTEAKHYEKWEEMARYEPYMSHNPCFIHPRTGRILAGVDGDATSWLEWKKVKRSRWWWFERKVVSRTYVTDLWTEAFKGPTGDVCPSVKANAEA